MPTPKKIPNKGATTKLNYAEKSLKQMRQKIKIGQKQLGLDTETYQLMLQNVTGTDKTSSTQLNQRELELVINHLRSRGAKLTLHKGKPHNIASNSPQVDAKLMQKIEALLADAHRDWSYLTARGRYPTSLLERMTKKQAVEFCTTADLRKIITALSMDAKRREAKELANG